MLEADASGNDIGAVLMQNGKPISFMSRTLGIKASAMSTYEKEALAILEALKKWKHYVSSSSLIIRTDQQSLKYIQEQRLVEGIQHKLLVKLLGYNYKVEYKKGIDNTAADALSCRPQEPAILALTTVVPQWIQQVTDSYASDPHCMHLMEKLAVDPTAVQYTTFKNGLLRVKGKLLVGPNGPLRQQLLEAFHQSALGGHSGERATYHRLKLVFYWPQMKHHVKQHVQECLVCQKNKSENVPYPSLLQPLPIPDMAWTHISMDFIEGLPKSNGKDVILAVVDKLTKYAHFLTLTHSQCKMSFNNLWTISSNFTVHLLSLSPTEIGYSPAAYGNLCSKL